MEEVLAVLVFCIVLFLYLHIYFHLKTSDDLEVYELEQPSKDKLEEICDLRQPVVFDYPNERLMDSCNIDTVRDNYGAFDVKIRNVKENDDDTEMYVPLPLKTTHDILHKDTEHRFISENNREFLDETGVVKGFQYNDAFLRPYMVSSCIYDLMFASKQTPTPLRYEVNYRNYFLVTQGRIRVMMIPPKDSKYLYPFNDYDNFEFRSPVTPWNVQHEYKADFDKIKTLEMDILPGMIISIPAFWWYSIMFDEGTSVCVFKYRTYMNSIAILPKLGMHFLQRQNVKREIAKKAAPLPSSAGGVVSSSAPASVSVSSASSSAAAITVVASSTAVTDMKTPQVEDVSIAPPAVPFPEMPKSGNTTNLDLNSSAVAILTDARNAIMPSNDDSMGSHQIIH